MAGHGAQDRESSWLDHPFLREGAGRWTHLRTWRAPSGVLLLAVLAGGERGLVGLGEVGDVARLLARAAEERGTVDLLTVPRGTVASGGGGALDWDWLMCDVEPGAQPGEDRVGPLGRQDLPDVRALLDAAYPPDLRPSADRPDLKRWGWRSTGGALLGTLSARELIPGGPVRLGGIATHPEARRRGVASALTAAATRAALRTGAPWVSLAIRSDNAAARAVYTRLGFQVRAELETFR